MGTVAVNFPKSPITKDSNALSPATLPNLCKFPAPPAPFMVVPLPNIGKSSLSPAGFTKDVTSEGSNVSIKGSSFKSTGDEASPLKGLISGLTCGITEYVTPGSMNVKFEGKNVQVLGDLTTNNAPPAGGGGGGGVASAVSAVPKAVPRKSKQKTEEEKAEKKLVVGLDKQKCRCGDEIRLKATSKNIPGGSIAFDLKQDGAVISSASGTLASDSADVPWQSKVATDKRPEPGIELTGSASGVSAKADKKLVIEKYADVSPGTKTIACRSGVFGWTGKFDIALTAGQVVVTTKIKLLNRLGPKPARPADAVPAVGEAVSDRDKLAMKVDIEGKLSGKHLLHRKDCRRSDGCDCAKARGCCKIGVRVVVEFVEAGAHHEVNLFQGPGRANARNWTRVKTRDNSYAHETGHLLAWYDEYAGGAVGAAPRWKVQQPVVMNRGLTVPPEYYSDFLEWLRLKTSENWTPLPP